MLWYLAVTLDYRHKNDIHPHHEFVECLSDDGLQWIDGVSYPFKKGRLFFIPAGFDHYAEGRPTAPAHLRLIHFSEEDIGPSFGADVSQLVNEIVDQRLFASDHSDDKCTELYDLMRECFESQRHHYELLMSAHATLLLDRHLMAQRTQKPKAQKAISSIDACCEQIQASPELPWSLEDCASKAAMNRTAFSLRFREVTGQSFSPYVTTQRIRKAVNLLINSTDSVLTVGLKSGYETSSNFYNHFQRIMGTTPLKYRKHYESQE